MQLYVRRNWFTPFIMTGYSWPQSSHPLTFVNLNLHDSKLLVIIHFIVEIVNGVLFRFLLLGGTLSKCCNLLSHTFAMLFITTARKYGSRELYPTLKLHSNSTSISRVSVVCEWSEGECRFPLIESHYILIEYFQNTGVYLYATMLLN